MVFGIVGAAIVGVIVPYLPTASDDINGMTQGIDVDSQTRPLWAQDAATFDDTPTATADPVLDKQDSAEDVVISADIATWNN